MLNVFDVSNVSASEDTQTQVCFGEDTVRIVIDGVVKLQDLGQFIEASI